MLALPKGLGANIKSHTRGNILYPLSACQLVQCLHRLIYFFQFTVFLKCFSPQPKYLGFSFQSGAAEKKMQRDASSGFLEVPLNSLSIGHKMKVGLPLEKVSAGVGLGGQGAVVQSHAPFFPAPSKV